MKLPLVSVCDIPIFSRIIRLRIKKPLQPEIATLNKAIGKDQGQIILNSSPPADINDKGLPLLAKSTILTKIDKIFPFFQMFISKMIKKSPPCE